MDINESIDTLHERTQQSKLEFSRHEAVCQERYEQLLKSMEIMSKNISEMHKEINELKLMATSGRISLKTLLWVGSVSGAVIGIVLAIGNYFK
jgi:SMC interacting uncharacterized protein involved in chromosome segregation